MHAVFGKIYIDETRFGNFRNYMYIGLERKKETKKKEKSG